MQLYEKLDEEFCTPAYLQKGVKYLTECEVGQHSTQRQHRASQHHMHDPVHHLGFSFSSLLGTWGLDVILVLSFESSCHMLIFGVGVSFCCVKSLSATNKSTCTVLPYVDRKLGPFALMQGPKYTFTISGGYCYIDKDTKSVTCVKPEVTLEKTAGTCTLKYTSPTTVFVSFPPMAATSCILHSWNTTCSHCMHCKSTAA